MSSTSTSTAQPTDLQSVIETLKATLEYCRQQAAHYTEEASRIETALLVLEKGFYQPEGDVSNGKTVQPQEAAVQADQVAQPSKSVLNQAEAELDEEKFVSQSKQRQSKTKRSSETFSLKDNLRARYIQLDLNDAIAKVLTLAPGPMEVPDLVDELYGRNLKRSLRSRAIAALTRHLNRGAKSGLWQQKAADGEPLAFSLS